MVMAWLQENQAAVLLGMGVLLAFWLVARKLRTANRKSPPGPSGIPYIGSLLSMVGHADHLHLTYAEFARKYGNVYMIHLGQKRFAVLNDNSSIQEALVNKSVIFADRPEVFLNKFVNPRRKGLGAAYFDDTFIRNKQVSLAIFRDLGLGRNVMEGRILSEARELLEAFVKQEAKPFDPSELLYVSVSNVMCSVMFNKRFTYNDPRFCDAVNTMHDVMKQVGQLVLVDCLPLVHYLPWVGRKINSVVHAFGKVEEFIQEELREHAETCDPRDHERDFITAYKHKMAGNLDHETLKFIVFDFFAGGTETTSNALSWALLFMANNPDIQSRVHKEIDKILAEGRPPSMSDRFEMPFTEAVLLETLRKSPPGPLAILHWLTADTSLNGLSLDKGTGVIVNIWAAHHDPDVWPDPDRFDPRRFLDDQGHVCGRQKIIPFSLGRRSCPGEALGRQELFLYFTSILQIFQVLPPPGQEKISERGVFGLILAPAPHKIVLEPRSSGHD